MNPSRRLSASPRGSPRRGQDAVPRIAPVLTPPPYPASRPRRLRREAWSRELVRESRVHASDLILPVFVLDGHDVVQDVASMPGVQRVTLDRLYPVAEECVALGIPVIALFPVLEPSLKSDDGREALNADGLVPRVVRELKKRFPELGVMTDVALDPFTSHGQDGLLDDDRLHRQRRDRRGARRAGAGAGRGRRRHRRAERHDGRPHRRDPQRARRRRPHPHPDHGVQRQVRERLLRPVPRRRRLGRQPRQEQQEGLPDGPGQQRRGAARGRARHRRGRRHGDGQARPAVPRHRPPRQGRVPHADLRLPGERRVRDAQGGGAERLARPRRDDDGSARRVQARRRRRRADVLRARRGAAAEARA